MHIILMGCGRLGTSLANALAADEHDVVVIDKDQATFANLGSAFNGITVTGTGIDIEVLKKAGIEHADAFVAVTSLDNANLMASQIARKIFSVPKVVARINDPRKRGAYAAFDVDTICPTDLGASRLRRMIEVRGVQVLESIGSGDVLQVRLMLPDGRSVWKLADLEQPGKVRVNCIERGDKAELPADGTYMEPGQHVWLTVHRDAMDQVRCLAREGGRE